MKTQRIFTKNADFQKFEVLKTNRNKRYRYRQFFVEGVRNINEAVKNGWQVDSFIYSFENQLSGWARNLLATVKTAVNYELTGPLMAEISDKTDTSEVCAIVRMREDRAADLKLGGNPLVAVFDRPSNKGNLGTVVRSCDALGIDALIITGHAVDRYDPETIVASMGSFFKLPVLYLPENTEVLSWIVSLRQAWPGIRIIGTSAHARQDISEVVMTGPSLLVIGNETDGMSTFFYSLCDELASIPMAPDSSASSFNVACAATVVLYEAVRQRKSQKPRQDSADSPNPPLQPAAASGA